MGVHAQFGRRREMADVGKVAGDTALSQALTPGAQRLVQAALARRAEWRHDALGVHHWLLALVERHAPMAEAMARDFLAAALRPRWEERLRAGDPGRPLSVEVVVAEAVKRAQGRGKAQATERDIASAILTAAGYELVEPSPAASVPTPTVLPGSFRPRAQRPTPTLDQFGRDLTREAAEGKLGPVVGREAEIQLVVETLCRRTKRNPVLVGPAGVGKTAIVEGLAARIVRGDVPGPLLGARVVAVQPSILVAGAGRVGELETRMRALLQEASQEGILLFIDEVHTMIGAGGMAGTSDVSSLLKPALARGDLACIAATTDDEYRRWIEPDAALERRFQPIRVQELSPTETQAVLFALRDELQRLRGVQVPDDVVRWLVDFAHQFLRNRYFPDKAVDLLEQCVAYAVTQGKTTVDSASAEVVAQRMVGMPLAVEDRLGALRQQLSERSLLTEEDAEALLNRLSVTVRGLDMRAARPNAVVLLAGDAAAHSGALAEVIAETLFGGGDRIVTIDLSRFVHPEDVTMLVGAAPGYVGHGESLAIHRIAQMPWCVARFEQVHACHPQVRHVLTQALADGFFTDSRGKRVFLSDAVVLLTAQITAPLRRPIGFRAAETPVEDTARRAALEALGAEFVAQVDLVCTRVPTSEAALRRWVEKHLLPAVAERFHKHGVDLHWDEEVIAWLLTRGEARETLRDWERFVDDHLSLLLAPYLASAQAKRVVLRIVKGEGETIRVEERGE
jgi:ATP-dependent Clp protease ATP-binding subunit ClpC